MYKHNNGNISVRFTNYTKIGQKSSETLICNEEGEAFMMMASKEVLMVKEIIKYLDKAFDYLMTLHNRDRNIVNKIYNEKYNLNCLDDIISGKIDMSNIFRTNEVIFMTKM